MSELGKSESAVRISSSAQMKPATRAGFAFRDLIGDKVRDMAKKYKKPTLHTTGKKWFVEFYFLVPREMRHAYKNKVWKRFKVYEDINRIKTLDYARNLRDAVEYGLKEGYDPFTPDTVIIEEVKAGIPQAKNWTIQQAVLYFKQKWATRGLEPSSLAKYERTADRLVAWLSAVSLQHKPAEFITTNHIEACVAYYKKENKWTNRSYNNELTFLATIFNFLLRKKIIKDNPCTGIDKQKAASKKHRYYDAKMLAIVKQALLRDDEYLHFAADMVYSSCIRSAKELLSMQVKNIDPDACQIFITAGGSKSNTDRYVPVPEQLMQRIKERGILEYPGDYYVFGSAGTPAKTPANKLFFSKRFRVIRRKLGLSEDYTLYGFKHTRVVHMKKDGAKDDIIMAVTGHKDFTSYTKYLRDLGLDVDAEAIALKTRAF